MADIFNAANMSFVVLNALKGCKKVLTNILFFTIISPVRLFCTEGIAVPMRVAQRRQEFCYNADF